MPSKYWLLFVDICLFLQKNLIFVIKILEIMPFSGVVKTKGYIKAFLLFFSFALLILLFVSGSPVLASDTLNYQGKITDASGINLPDGDYRFKLRVYDSPGLGVPVSGGNLLYEQEKVVTVKSGIFNIEFTPNPELLGGNAYLMVCFNSQKEGGPNSNTNDGIPACGNGVFDKAFSPRKKISATPYSFFSMFLGSNQIKGENGVLIFTGIASEPVLSNSGEGRMYYDSSLSKFRCSFDGDSYQDCFGGTSSTGVSSIIAGNGLSGGTITNTGTISINAPVCANNENLTWNGTTFGCASDQSAVYTAGSGINISGSSIVNTGILTLNTTSPISSTGGQNPTISIAACSNNQVLKYNSGSSSWICASDVDSVGVTQVSTSGPLTGGPITASGTIGITQSTTSTDGYLSSADWNTFNNKQNSLTIGNISTSTTGVTINGGSGSVIGSGVTVNIATSSNTQTGLLSSADWINFNSKQDALSSIGDLVTSTSGVSVTSGSGAVIGSGTSININTASGSQNGLLSSSDWNTFSSKENPLSFTSPLNRTVDNISLSACANGEILKYSTGSSSWVCSSDIDTDTNSGGTVTQIDSGNGLTGGPITTTGSLSINSPTCAASERLSWNGNAFVCVDTSLSGGTPAGNNGEIQFNHSGSFGASNNLFWDNSLGRLGLGDATPDFALDSVGNINTDGSYYLGGNVILRRSNAKNSIALGKGTAEIDATDAVGSILIGDNVGSSMVTDSNSSYTIGTIAIGTNSLNSFTYGSSNTVIGQASAYSMTQGDYNTFLGLYTGYLLDTGARNTFLGTYAGRYLTSGSNNIFIGTESGVQSGGNTTISDSIVIGYNLKATENNQLIIGGTDGYFGNGVKSTSPTDFNLNATGGEGINKSGANLFLAGGSSTGTASGGSISFSTTPAGTISGTDENVAYSRLVIDSEGAFSYGTASSTPSLSTASTGKMYFDGTKFKCSENGGAYVDCVGGGTVTPAGSNGQVQFNNNGTFGASSNLFWDNSNSNLGIGVNNPTNKLEVAGSIYLNSTSAYLISKDFDGEADETRWISRDNSWVAWQSAVAIGDYGNGTVPLTGSGQLNVSSTAFFNGNVGIGNSNPQTRLAISYSNSSTSSILTNTDSALDIYNTVDDSANSIGSLLTFSSDYDQSGNGSGPFIKSTRAAIKGASNISGNSGSGYLSFFTNRAAGNSLQERMRILGNDTQNFFYFGNGVTNTSPSSSFLYGTSGTGTNIAGGNLTFAGGQSTGTASGGYIAFSTSPAGGASGASLNPLSERMRINSIGNVGIGTTSPEFKLTLGNDGGIYAIGTFGSGAQLVNTPTDAALLWYPKKAAFRVGYTPGIWSSDANIANYSIGIGANTIANAEAGIAIGNHVAASGQYSVSIGKDIVNSGFGSYSIGESLNNYGYKSLALGFNMYLSEDADGSVGIGLGSWPHHAMTVPNTMSVQGGGLAVNAPSIPAVDELMYVNGNIRIGSGTTGCVRDADGTTLVGTCSSDIRLKKDIRPFGDVLNNYSKLEPVWYKWRSDEFPEMALGTSDNIGLIAQDVQTLFPELVVEDSRGYLQIDYTTLQFYTIEALIELINKVDSGEVGSNAWVYSDSAYELNSNAVIRGSLIVNQEISTPIIRTDLITIGGGNLILSQNGNITTNGSVSADYVESSEINSDKVSVANLSVNSFSVDGDPTIGSGRIDPESTRVVIANSNITSGSKVFLTPRTLTDKNLVVTEIIEGESFTVEILSPTPDEIQFDYWIVGE